MPFILPIQSSYQPAGALLTFAGETTLALASTATQGGRLVLAGSTQLDLQSVQSSSISFEGATQLMLTGPQSYGSINFEGATQLMLTGGVGVSARLSLDGATQLSLRGTYMKPEEFGFTIFLDIIGAGLQGSHSATYRARLIADGLYDEEGAYIDGGAYIPVSSFDLNAPEGAVGVSLSVTLAKPDVTLVTNAAVLQFDLGVWTGSAFEWVTMMRGGKLAGRALTIGFARGGPQDSVTLTLIDVVADRWTLAPGQPSTLYDPDVMGEPAGPDPDSFVVDELGARIEPIFTPVSGLTLREILRRAYVEGCGFDKVVTNIPDFPVREVTFTLEGGYHEAVKPLLALFTPVYFADGTDLWIIDPGAQLPAGLNPRELPISAYVQVTDTTPARQPLSSIIVAYSSAGASGGDYFTERLKTEAQESGTFGVQGYTRTETERRVREYRNFNAPEVVVREEVASIAVTTEDFQLNVIGRETQTDTFDVLGRKSGHRRSVEALVPDLAGDGALTLQTVTEEQYSVLYRAGRSGDEIATTISETSGLVLADKGRQYLGKPYELAFTDAHQSGYIDPDGDQSAEFRAIRTVTETYVREGAGVLVRRQVANHLNGGSIEQTTAQTRAGSTAVNRRGQGIVRRKLTLTGGVGGRIVPTYGTGDLPADLAIDLGWRYLQNLNNPPRELSARLPVVSFDLRRGTPVRAHSRTGVLGVYVVTSSRVTGDNLGTGNQLVQMSVMGKELKP